MYIKETEQDSIISVKTENNKGRKIKCGPK